MKGTHWRIVYDICRRDGVELQPVVLAECGGIETLEEAQMLREALKDADRDIDRDRRRTYEIFPLVKHENYGTVRLTDDMDETDKLRGPDDGSSQSGASN